MNFSLFIARRYLMNKTSNNIVNIISYLSVIGVLIGTAALVLVLSVFNGFEDLLLRMYNSFDPHISITSNKAKTFDPNQITPFLTDSNKILYLSEVLEQQVLIKSGSQEYIAVVKGVSDDFRLMTNLDSLIIYGDHYSGIGTDNVALVGEGVAFHLSIALKNIFKQLKVFVPNREKNTLLDAPSAFTISSVVPTGIFSIQSDYDNKYVITPIGFLQDLVNKKEVSSIQIKLIDPANMLDVQESLILKLGKEYLVKNQYQQHAFLYKILNSEKLMVSLILIFIFLIATFNIIGSLSMIILDKKEDIKTLWHLGANKNNIQRVFFNEGVMVIMIGNILGICFGVLLAYIQMRYKFISMGQGNFIINHYPVSINYMDIFWIGVTVSLVGLLASWYPSKILIKKLINP